MKIGLIDVDGHNFPNLPLMKLSAHHKARGDAVDWCIPLEPYDVVYMSKVFTFSPDFDTHIRADKIIRGGTGYGLKDRLPDAVEHAYPDYALYGITNTAYGFLTRGCPRNCSFCIVSKKEGRESRTVADLNEFWAGQKNIKLLDPNLLACCDWKWHLQQLGKSGAWVDFTQGLDVRLMDEEKAAYLKQVKCKMIHFAWDNYEFETYKKLQQIRPLLPYDSRKLRVYVLTNFNTVQEQDLERIYKLRELGYDPFVMVYDRERAPKRIKRVQRWCNNKWIFRSVERFEDYVG